MKPHQKILTAAALMLMFLPRLLPGLPGLNPVGSATVYIFVGTVILLIGVSLTWPVFLCILAFAFNGVYPLAEVIRMCLGNPILWFMMLNGVVIGAIEKTGLFRRLALWIACRPITRRSPWLFLTAFFLSCMLCGSLMNTTAAYLLFLTLSTEVLRQLGLEKGRGFATVFMVTVMAVANVSHAVTPFGHSITIMSIDYFAPFQGLDFLQYSVAGYACGALGIVLTVLAARFLLRLDAAPLRNFDPAALAGERRPLSKAEKVGGGVMLGTILWWLAPTLIPPSLPGLYHFVHSQMGILAPLLAALVLLCFVHLDGKPMIQIESAITTAPWRAGLTVGISLFLGAALQNGEAGIIGAVSGAMEPICSRMPPIAFVVLITLLVMVMSNFMSCTLSLMVGGIVTVTLMSGGAVTGIHGGALAVALTFSAQAAFATAPASAPAAICAGEGWVSPGRQLRYGFLYALIWWAVGLAGYGATALIFG